MEVLNFNSDRFKVKCIYCYNTLKNRYFFHRYLVHLVFSFHLLVVNFCFSQSNVEEQQVFKVKLNSGHAGKVIMFDLSEDEKNILTLSLDGTIRYWETNSSREILKVEVGGLDKILSIHILKDSGFAVVSETSCYIYGFKSRSLESKIKGQFISSHLSSSQTYLFLGERGVVYRYNVKSNTLEHTYNLPTRIKVTSIHFQEREEVLAVGTGNGICYLFDGNSKTLSSFKITNNVLTVKSDVIISQNGQFVIAAASGTLTVYSLSQTKVLYELGYNSGVRGEIIQLGFLQDKNQIVTSSFKSPLKVNKLCIWDFGTGKKLFDKDFIDLGQIKSTVGLSEYEMPQMNAGGSFFVQPIGRSEYLMPTFILCSNKSDRIFFTDGNGVSYLERSNEKATILINSSVNEISDISIQGDSISNTILFTLNDQINVWEQSNSALEKNVLEVGYPLMSAELSSDRDLIALSYKKWGQGIVFSGEFTSKSEIWSLDERKRKMSFGAINFYTRDTAEQDLEIVDFKFGLISKKIFRASFNGVESFELDVPTKATVFDKKSYTNANGALVSAFAGRVKGFSFNSTGNQFLVEFDDGIGLYSIQNSNLNHFIKVADADRSKDYSQASASFFPVGNHYAITDTPNSIALLDESHNTYATFYHDKPVKSFCLSSDGNKLYSLADEIVAWDLGNRKKLMQVQTDSPPIEILRLPYSDKVTTVHKNGELRFWNFNAMKPYLYTIHTTRGEGEFLISSPILVDGMDSGYQYFYASKKTSKDLYYVKGLDLYSFDQFDLIFNRPDKIMKMVGLDDDLVKLYEVAYKKRLQKMGFNKERVEDYFNYSPRTGFNVPTLLVNDDFLRYRETDSKSISIPFEAFDPKGFKLDRLMVTVNDVPIYGVQGKTLNTPVEGKLEESLKIELTPGKNIIGIKVLNSQGIYSFEEIIEVTCTAKFDQPDLYVVSIGASDYQNDLFNLNYAAKDANDLIRQYESGKNFNKVHVLAFTNASVTRNRITEVKQRLMDSKPNDHVVIFYAGHGLLDDNYNYYLSTYDTDFASPSGQALPYESLEGLLDGIPARNKLMLIDACHSGEVDKEELVESSDQIVNNGNIKSRGFTKVKQKQGSLGLPNSFELMKQLFNDVRSSTGAVVISSASGVEYAFESPEWNNGVFTYALLEGLKSKSADQNDDGVVRVSELREYIFDRVTQLTDGKQHPTSRRENLENDFVVWKY